MTLNLVNRVNTMNLTHLVKLFATVRMILLPYLLLKDCLTKRVKR